MSPTIRARKRYSASLGALLLLLAVLLGTAAPASGEDPAARLPVSSLSLAGPVTITGLDLHDGQLQKYGSTFYLYGTMYGCGYTWMTTSPWCGFGVSTATDINGPWSTPTLLFPANAADPYNPGHTYQAVCGQGGAGCFSPRMVQRTGWGANDGVYVLWFNGPAWMNAANGSAPHGYMAMGCNGPAGPCGATAGAPYGSTYRPVLHQCNGANGDAGLSAQPDNGSIALICPMAGTTSVAIEQIDKWGTNGTGVGTTNVAGLSHVEAMGAYRDAATGTWVMTFSDPNCGYCAGDPTGYATAPALLGPWTAPANVGVAGPTNGRRALSANSCGGQPDTVSVIDGQAWQKVDLWTGQMNETGAGLLFEPLNYSPASGTGTAGDGHVFHPPFYDWTCS